MATSQARESGRERILGAAYDLFVRHGIRAVGVDRVIEQAGVAKATLYRNFRSKDDLVLAVLDRRAELWTEGWLQAEVTRRTTSPVEQLLTIFDVFGEWFEEDSFEGCSFINVMLEFDDPANTVRVASVEHLADIRSFLSRVAGEAGISEPEDFARQWHILMKGSIVSAGEGDRNAAARAREMGTLLLEHRLPAPA